MIKITIVKKKDVTEKINIKGHAMYGASGTDIVCASVSSIAITTVNAIVRYDKNAIEYDEHDGCLTVNILKHDNVIDMLISNMLDLFDSLVKQYPQNVKII